MIEKTCKNCKKTYMAKTERSQFCSTSCRSSYWQKQHRKSEKRKKWFQEPVPIWMLYLVLTMFAGAMIFLFQQMDEVSRLEKKVEQQQQIIQGEMDPD